MAHFLPLYIFWAIDCSHLLPKYVIFVHELVPCEPRVLQLKTYIFNHIVHIISLT